MWFENLKIHDKEQKNYLFTTTNVNVIVIFKVANRKDVFPPETWFMDEDCQLWIESWNWQQCKNISLTKKVKRSQEQSGLYVECIFFQIFLS